MKLCNLLFCAVCLIMYHSTTYGWSKKGHDVIAHIAERHLDESTKVIVTDLLDGRSMVYYANWMDNASYTKEFKETKTWHYFNIERKKSVRTTKRIKDGDLLSALIQIEAELRSGTLGRKELSDRLKMFIHLLGDMHQPMHLGQLEDHGGNTIPVTYFNEATSLHSLWDYFIVEGAHDWSYTEWAQQIDILGDDEVASITSGDYLDWLEATHNECVEIYRNTPVETRVSYDYIEKYRPVVEQQLLYAGLRLGALLNDIY